MLIDLMSSSDQEVQLSAFEKQESACYPRGGFGFFSAVLRIAFLNANFRSFSDGFQECLGS